jgi:hypothetical protein
MEVMEGVPSGQVRTLLAIKEALEAAGIEFIGTPRTPDHQDAQVNDMSESANKPKGGPKKAKGKRASSQNYLVHRATSNNVISADQRVLVERYENGLMTYYKPESPLEKLQIQRIALCKAKLDALYELELLKLQIARAELEGNPKLALDKVHPGEDLTRSFA